MHFLVRLAYLACDETLACGIEIINDVIPCIQFVNERFEVGPIALVENDVFDNVVIPERSGKRNGILPATRGRSGVVRAVAGTGT